MALNILRELNFKKRCQYIKEITSNFNNSFSFSQNLRCSCFEILNSINTIIIQFQ